MDYDAEAVPPGFELDAAGQVSEIPELIFNRAQSNSEMSPLELELRRDLWPVFFETYARTGRFVAACGAIGGVSPSAVTKLARQNPSFYQGLRDSIAVYASTVHAELQRRAIHGVTKPIYFKGELVGTVQEYSDRLLELELRRVDPEFRTLLAPPKSTGTAVQVNVSTTTVAGIVPPSSDDAAQRKALDPRQMTQAERDALRLLLRGRTQDQPTTGTPTAPARILDALATETPAARSLGSGGTQGDHAAEGVVIALGAEGSDDSSDG